MPNHYAMIGMATVVDGSPLYYDATNEKGVSMADGIHVYDNPFGVLTDNPPFAYRRVNLSNYMALHVGPADRRFREDVPLHNYSPGMGALGCRAIFPAHPDLSGRSS